MGYIDLEGNFWSLGRVGRNPFGSFAKCSFDGMKEIADSMAQVLVTDIHQGSLEVSSDFNKHLPDFWPADKVLLSLGFCRFYRGYYDRNESYVELSKYDNANILQLFVMNYLFALNSVYASTDMENERQTLIKKLIQK